MVRSDFKTWKCLTEIVTVQLHFNNGEKQDMDKITVNLINHSMFASI